ncbi:MAG TPA: FAD-dependent oxidoreductase, partial [Steroidobacteraceae bacterium]|nr:FAD-dependent oxidoreductase [Steroidobacteraceae bacterium]
MTRRPRAWRTDTVVIGAGAAGLAAASELARAGRRCIVLEARGRIGGRVYTIAGGATTAGAQNDHDAWPPLELGAEFIHGESPPTRRWMEACGQVVLDTASERWVRRGHDLHRADGQFEALKRCLERLPTPHAGVSFEEYL